jgi:glycosyltransferase involved in cell wall biosynthesis
MHYYMVMTAYNEADFIEKTLHSIINQTFLPKKMVVVNDNSTDETEEIVTEFCLKYDWIQLINRTSSEEHLPGAKVIQAFNQGLAVLDNAYDFIVKADADLIFPENYFKTIREIFETQTDIGMLGGFAYIEKENQWLLEHLTDADHIRGAFKAYRKSCFENIGGLKASMGWDTVDELLAKFYGWKVVTIPELHVKHLKPTGQRYDQKSRFLQGEAFYKLGYGWTLTLIASSKLAFRKKKLSLILDYMQGFWKAQRKQITQLVNEEQAQFIRNYRWKKIKQKLLNRA